MILYVNGDSHSEGHDAVVKGPNLEHSYGKLLADRLGYEFACDARAGCSNDSIIRRTIKYLETNKPDFLIIGWSTFERQDWFHRNRHYQVTASGYDKLPKGLHERYKQFVIDSTKPETQWRTEKETHKKIIDLHLNLNKRRIKHLFFNCYSWFFYHDAHSWNKFDWQDAYIDPYQKNMTYYFWLEQRGYKPKNKKYYHYGADAHEAWADFLLPKVQDIVHAK